MSLIGECARALDAGGEPAMLAALFDRLRVASGFCVEFGAKGRGPTWSLRQAPGWKALLMDCESHDDPAIVTARVTAENIDDLFSEHGVPPDFDFLSIDIDGNDYWVWKALDASRFHPKAVCIEYNCFFPPTLAVTVPYDPQRVYRRDRYYGASAAALYKLARSKGYSLICVVGFMNLLFVRNDLLTPEEQHVPLERIFVHPVDIEDFARRQGFNWRPSWIDAPPPDLKNERWIEV